MQDLVDPFQGGLAPLDQVGHPAQGHHGPGQQPEITDKGYKVAGGDFLHDGLPAAEIEDDGQAKVGEQQHHGEEGAGNFNQFEVFFYIAFGNFFQSERFNLFAVVGLDDTDAGKALPHAFGKVGKGPLHRPIAQVHLFAEKTRTQNNKGHGNQHKGGEPKIDPGHETDGRSPQNDRIVDGHQPHPGGHPDLLNVIGGMRHQVTGSGFIEKGGRQGLGVVEESVAQPFFNPAGGPQEKPAPEISKESNHQTDGENRACMDGQARRGGSKAGQIVNGQFDHPWNGQLQKIHQDQADKSQEYNHPVLDEIGLYEINRFQCIRDHSL